MNKDLSIIILNYNAKKYLKACLDSIKKSKVNFSYEVVIVDNVSTDGSREDIEKVYSNFLNTKIVLNSENSGFSKGNNLGVKKSSGRYVLFLNPDTVLSPNALQIVFDYLEVNREVGVVGAKLLLESGELDSACHRGFPTPWNAMCQFMGLRMLFPKSVLFAGYSKGWLLDDDKPHEVDVISGAFFFVRREIGVKIGWWSEDYFMYGEDIDFAYNVKRLGWKIVFLPNAKVLHYGGVTAGIRKHIKNISTASKETRIRSAKASTQAMRIFYQKHYTSRYPFVLRFLVLFSIRILEQLRVWKINYL